MSILSSTPNNGFIAKKSIGEIISSFTESILTLVSWLSKSSLWLSLKSSTKNPDLNLSPVASLICKVFVSTSNKLKLVIISKFSILSSNFPISLMVYLLLSINLISASFEL